MTEPAHHTHTRSDKHAVHLKLVDRLRRQAAEVRRLTRGLDESQLAASPIPGKWSLKQLVCHFGRMEEVFAERFDKLLTEDNPAIVPYDSPDSDETFVAMQTRSTEDVLNDYLRRREALCRRLEAISPAEWHRRGVHPKFANFDVHFQVEYMAHHEAHHIYQLFERRVPLGNLPH